MSGPSRLSGFPTSVQQTDGASVSSRTSSTHGGMRWKPSVFDYKSGGGKTCPTCHGTGRIPKGQEDELVALIPYNDKRLKPRRTCLYVCIVAAVILVCGGVLTGFLYPRNVTVTILLFNSTNKVFNIRPAVNTNASNTTNTTTPLLEIQTSVQIKNSNFFPVSVSVLNVSLSLTDTEVGLYSWNNTLRIGSKVTEAVVIKQNATFGSDKDVRRRVVDLCASPNWDEGQFLFMKSTVLLSYVYLSRSSDVIESVTSHIDCRFIEFAPAISNVIPPITPVL